jgi:uncharacterized lipoprotein YajG
MKAYWFIVIAAALLSGCAFNSQKVSFDPTISNPKTSEGHGVTVAVRVVDERPSKSLGRRGAGIAVAEITTNADLAVIVQGKISQALQQQGFVVADTSGDAKLTVEIRLLHYSSSIGFWTAGVQVQAALKAIASKSDKTFEEMYRSDSEERILIVPTAETNAEWINKGLGDVISKLVSDPKLIAFLAG